MGYCINVSKDKCGYITVEVNQSSRDDRPAGSGHIHPITGRHSLFPASHTRSADSFPCGSPAQRAARRAYHVPYSPHDCVRVRLFTGGVHSDVFHSWSGIADHIPFGKSQSAALAQHWLRCLLTIRLYYPWQPALPLNPIAARSLYISPHSKMHPKGDVVRGASNHTVAGVARPRRLLSVAKQVRCHRSKTMAEQWQIEHHSTCCKQPSLREL